MLLYGNSGSFHNVDLSYSRALMKKRKKQLRCLVCLRKVLPCISLARTGQMATLGCKDNEEGL